MFFLKLFLICKQNRVMRKTQSEDFLDVVTWRYLLRQGQGGRGAREGQEHQAVHPVHHCQEDQEDPVEK